MQPLLALLVPAFLLGLLLGSFVNVLISRVPPDRSIITPRSHCPICQHPIRWYDNIPLLSWILLRARCRDCRTPISWRYPAVELLTALWFTAVAARAFHALSLVTPGHQPELDQYLTIAITTLSLLTLGCLLLTLAVIDWQTQLLPDVLTIPGILFGFLFTCAQAALLPTGVNDLHFDPKRAARLRSPGSFIARGDVFLTGTERLVYGRFFAILGVVVLLLLIRCLYKALRHRQGMGLGDVKLLALLAAFLGFWPSILALFLGVFAGSLFALVLLATGRAHRTTRLPFGSFLASGGLVSALFAGPILAWYQTLL